MANNWMELGLTADEEAFVRKGAALYKTLYLDTIDNVFVIARSIEILRKRHLGSGIKGGFADALVQYGFTSRDGGPMNKAIRSFHKTLLDHEAEVRKWWDSVKEPKKRDWLSAKAICSHWKASTKHRDPDAPKKPSPLQQERTTNVFLQEELHKANEKLKTSDEGDRFKPTDTADDIATVLVSMFSPSKAESIARALLAKLKTRKPAKPKT